MSAERPVKRAGRRGRKPSKIDQKARLERSRQSARECRARKKLRYQYLEELVVLRERSIFSLREELERLKQWCIQMDKGHIPAGLQEMFLAQSSTSNSNSSECKPMSGVLQTPMTSHRSAAATAAMAINMSEKNHTLSIPEDFQIPHMSHTMTHEDVNFVVKTEDYHNMQLPLTSSSNYLMPTAPSGSDICDSRINQPFNGHQFCHHKLPMAIQGFKYPVYSPADMK